MYVNHRRKQSLQSLGDCRWREKAPDSIKITKPVLPYCALNIVHLHTFHGEVLKAHHVVDLLEVRIETLSPNGDVLVEAAA